MEQTLVMYEVLIITEKVEKTTEFVERMKKIQEWH